MKSLKNKNLIFIGLLFAAALTMSPANAWASNQKGFYLLSSDGTVETDPAPIIRYLDPNWANAGEPGKTVHVIGDNFEAGSLVRFNGGARPTIYVNPSHLIMQLDEYDLRNASKNVVTVKNSDGQISNPATFTVRSTTVSTNTNKGTVLGATTAKKPVAKATTKKATVAKATTKCADTGSVAGASTTNTNNGMDKNLTASAGSANASFVPNTLVGWMTLFILIMLAVVLFRKLWVTEAEKNAPLKHA